MTDEKRDAEESIFRVDTVPPPPGEDDAYSATTKVGPVTAEAWVDLIRKADEDEAKAVEAAASERFGPKKVASSKTPETPTGSSSRQAGPTPADAPSDAGAAPIAVPKVYHAEDEPDEDHAATLLNPLASKLVDSSARADESILGDHGGGSDPLEASVEKIAPALGDAPPAPRVFPLHFVMLGLFAAGVAWWLFAR